MIANKVHIKHLPFFSIVNQCLAAKEKSRFDNPLLRNTNLSKSEEIMLAIFQLEDANKPV